MHRVTQQSPCDKVSAFALRGYAKMCPACGPYVCECVCVCAPLQHVDPVISPVESAGPPLSDNQRGQAEGRGGRSTAP